MVKSLVSKLSSASSTLSIASTFGKSHDNSTASSSSAAGSTSASTAISGDNYLKYRNDPGRFFGDGVQFKAKLIGILEVGEARGDRMCQEALQDLKMAIRAAGEHKQRITIHVTIDGLRLRDEKTGDSLYHHPVHKISFIAQDMTDSRAFGYIFGSPDSGHRFFGIKTDKAASQVVLAMRDLFQVVFELKKKEIELARQQIQSKSLHHHDTQHQLSSLSSLKSAAAGTSGQNDLSGLGGSNTSAATLSMLNTMVSSSTNTPNASRLGVNLDSKGASKEISPESVADLVDLEQELSSLQRGITQMERITPNDSHSQQISTNATKTSTAGGSGSDDPFGDSFTSFPTLPPPEPGRLRSKTTTKPNDTNTTNVTTTTTGLNATATTATSSNLQPLDDDDDNWLRELDAHNDVFDTSKTVVPGLMGMPPLASTLSSSVPLASRAPLAARESSDTPPNHIYETVSCSANNTLPTDMVELTNLSNNTTTNNAETNVNNLANSSSLSDIFQTAAAEAQNAKLDIKSEPVTIATNNEAVMLPRDTDPFSPTRKKSDPFEEGGDLFSKLDPFEFEFNNSNLTETKDKTTRNVNTSLSPSADLQSSNNSQTSQDLLAGHLQVNLPPENDTNQTSTSIRSRPIPGSSIAAQQSSTSIAPPMANALPPASMLKQQTVDVISSISNKKMPHLFGQSSRFSKRDSNSINMRRLQESDSLSETETAPEPPPRPDYASCVEPPPLPPKKQFNDFVIRTRAATNHSLNSSNSQSLASNRYDSLNSAMATKTLTGGRSASTDVPPIPLPSRRVGRTDGSYPGPGRPRKPGHTEDDYLAPIAMSGTAAGSSNAGNNLISDVPPLLPPPTQTSSRTRTQRQQSLTQQQQSKAHEIYENKSEILQQIQQQQQQQQQQQNILEQHSSAPAAIVPDITLTQLLTLGIDELALKLNVPTSKLSTMTLVELTSYLSEFLEQSKPSKMEPKVETSHEEKPQQTPPIFKVNFDQEATFVAKFDDTFGEDFQQHISASNNNTSFEANFAQFDSVNVEPPVQSSSNQNANMVPSADRYAVFREIIDQELQQQQESVDLIGDVMDTEVPAASEDQQFESNTIRDLDINVNQQQDLLSGDMLEVSGPQPPKIDTKITEVLAQAKDRYAALRDLILVENLFDKPPPKPPSITTETEGDNKSPFQGFTGFNDDEEDQDLRQLMDQATTLDSNTQQQRLGLVDSRGFLVEPSSSAITVEDEDEEEEERRNQGREDAGVLSSADSNEKEQDKDTLPSTKYEQLASSNQQLEEIEEKPEKFDENPQISITQTQMASSNDSKYLSVVSVASSGLSGSKDDLEIDDLMHRAISNLSLDSRERSSPAQSAGQQQQNTHTVTTTMTPPHFNDVSTSPIPIQQRSPGPSLTSQQNKSPNNKSPQQQISPLPTQLTVVSQLIDTATKQIQNDNTSKTSNDSWATFDTPQHQPVVQSDKRARPAAKHVAKANNFLNLPPPPGSISNCSQNDSAIESPCSSDPREEAWHKHNVGGSSLSLGHQTAALGGSSQRRYHKKERQNTSSSSRDLSWDEDQGGNIPPPPHMLDYPPNKRLAGQLQGSLTTDRHGYYRRHARRMNSCDDEYEYEQDFGTNRRDRESCKYKHSLSRSRDNFDMDSPGWYHHHGAQLPHHTWSSQDIEQARGRNFERAAYERTTYGPPIYDKRGVGPALPPTSSYDRRSAGGGVYDKRSKYYRGDSNPRSAERIYNLDEFGDVLSASGKIPPHLASMYEEMKGECFSPTMPTHRQRAADYMYERDRKSFDRESLESYEGSNVPPRRRRRSYDSGGVPSDPYGSCDSREEYHGRERCVMTADKSRSLRKSLKSLRVTGDIDYDQDSEKEYHYRDQRSRCDTRSLQRPSQLSTQGVGGGLGAGSGSSVMGSQGRIRKSSGSSPWDGEEPPLPGQKSTTSSWKRPSSAAEAERRRAAVKGQTPSGSDEDKDRRYRKKRTTRSKDLPAIPSSAGRYGRTGNYDYISCEDLDDDAEDYVDEEEEEEDHGIERDDERSPADEDKFARLEMRRHEMHNRMMDAHVRRRKEVPPSQTQMAPMSYRKVGKAGYIRRPLPPPTEPKHPEDYGFDDDGDDGEYEQTPTPRSNTSSALPTATPNASTKFSFDVGFESDFNQSSPPPAPAGTASSCNSTPAANVSAANTPASKSSFRFSNDFSGGQDREKHYQHPPAGSLQQYDLENRVISSPQTSTQTSTPKLRFDDNVKVSQFDDAFEDDFSKATFDAFQNDDVQWQESLQKTAKQQMRNNKLQQRQQELIKKSESVNIFAKKVEDPFEDDEFFNSPPTSTATTNTNDKTENNGGGNATVTANNVTTGSQVSSGWDDDNTNFAKFDENM